MQSGYRRDRDAGAKALKVAVKNSKKDKVLYGAVIKAESVFSSLTTQPKPSLSGPSQPSNIGDVYAMMGEASSGGPPAPPTPPVSTMQAPTVSSSMATTASTTSRSSAASRGLPPNPFMQALQQGATALRSTIAPRNVPETPATNQPTPPTSGLVITTDLLSQLRSKLRPTKTTELSPTQRADLVARTPLRPVQSIPPISTGSIPVLETSGETTPILSPVSSTGTSETLPPLATITETLKPAKGSPTASSQAPTVASTVATQKDLPTVPSSDDEPPLLQSDLYNLNDDQGKSAQAAAKELLSKINQQQRDVGVKETKQTTITAITLGGQGVGKLIIKFNQNRYQFDLKVRGGKNPTTRSMRWSPDVETGISVIRSLTHALEGMKQEKYDPKAKVGETTGLGVADIKSQRVVFRSRKSGNGDLTRNQIYVMEPQLMRGHLRAYNRSGRPAISRSNISPAFARIVQDIVERNTFEPDDYSSLEAKESADANQFIALTKPIQPRNIDRLSNADTVWQLKKRYEVLVGQLSSGNTGKLVRDEMETILRTLIRLHAMNNDKGLSLIRALREF